MYPTPDACPYQSVATHMPVLWTVLSMTGFNDIYEFGAGLHSTRLLGAWTKGADKPLLTVENDPAWMPRPLHSKHLVLRSDDTWTSSPGKFSLAFIDCEARSRAPVLDKLLDDTQCGTVVIHDTEPLQDRAYDVARRTMRWRDGEVVNCPWHGIQTTVVTREAMPDDMRRTLKRLNQNPGLHSLRWEMLQIFIRAQLGT